MPYVSDAQRRFFHAAEARGDIKQSTVNEFDKESKGMKLPEHVKKLYEGGLISHDEYEGFNARYHTSEGQEERSEQEMPSMSPEEGNKYEPHNESPLPNGGVDEYLTAEDNEDRLDYDPVQTEEPSRDFLDALMRRNRSRRR